MDCNRFVHYDFSTWLQNRIFRGNKLLGWKHEECNGKIYTFIICK